MSKSKWNASHVTTSKVVSKRSRTPAFNTALGVLVKLTWYMISIVLGGSTYFLHLWNEQVGGWFPISALSPVQRKITYTTSPRSFFSVGKLCHEASEVGWMLHGKDHVPLFLFFFAGGDVLSVTEKTSPKIIIWFEVDEWIVDSTQKEIYVTWWFVGLLDRSGGLEL